MNIEPLAGTIGASVSELDLRDLTDTDATQLRDAWLQHLVLFFPGQQLSASEQRDFAQRFGTLEVHPLTEKLEGTPEVTVLHSERGGRADVWHSDVTFNESPPIAAVLQQISGPESGGDTMWANQYEAFTAMSPAMQDFLRGLTAIHTAWPQGHPEMKAERPVVLRHPETGREALAVNRLFTTRIPQLEQSESDSLLTHLFLWGEKLEFTCRWSWSPGDLAIWDNRCTRHYAIGDYETERIMHRVTVLGDYIGNENRSSWKPHHEVSRLSASSAFVKR